VGQFEISLSKDCQVELVETGFRNEIAFDKLRLTSREFQTDPLPTDRRQLQLSKNPLNCALNDCFYEFFH